DVEYQPSFSLTDQYGFVNYQPCNPTFGGGDLFLMDPEFISGGTAPFEFYEIRNGSRYQPINISYAVATPRDSIQIEVEDANGCSAFTTIYIPFGDFPEIEEVIIPTNCPMDDNVISVTFEHSGLSDFGDTWEVSISKAGIPLDVISTNNNFIALSNGAGEYEVTLTFINNPVCSTTFHFNQEIYPNLGPLAISTSTTDQCGDNLGELLIDISGGY